VSKLRSGTHTITAAVADSGGKTAEARTTVVVNTPPQLRIVAPTDRSVLVPGDLVRFEGTAADVEDGDLSAAVTWTSSVDGPLGPGSRLDVGRLRSGTHTITASVADRGGKTASGALTVVVNAPPVLAITSPADGFDSVPGAAIIFTASASDTEDGSLDAAIRWSSSLDGPLGAGPTLRV